MQRHRELSLVTLLSLFFILFSLNVSHLNFSTQITYTFWGFNSVLFMVCVSGLYEL